MTREEQRKVDFYQGNAVHMVLKRYEFSDAEKKIVQAAIVTAKRDKPNMTIIEKSDALLKMIASSRSARAEELDMLETKKQASRLKMSAYATPETQFLKKPIDKSTITLVSVLVWGALVLTGNYFFGNHVSASVPAPANGAEVHLDLYSFNDAQELCAKNAKVLPLSVDDAIDYLGAPDSFNTKGYWSAKGKVIYNMAQGYGNEDTQKHYVVCVDKNGKGFHFIP